MIFKRKVYEKLLEWKKCDGSEALMIEGARRVGKSTIVKEFAQNEYESFLLIDFARTSEDVKCRTMVSTSDCGSDNVGSIPIGHIYNMPYVRVVRERS